MRVAGIGAQFVGVGCLFNAPAGALVPAKAAFPLHPADSVQAVQTTLRGGDVASHAGRDRLMAGVKAAIVTEHGHQHQGDILTRGRDPIGAAILPDEIFETRAGVAVQRGAPTVPEHRSLTPSGHRQGFPMRGRSLDPSSDQAAILLALNLGLSNLSDGQKMEFSRSHSLPILLALIAVAPYKGAAVFVCTAIRIVGRVPKRPVPQCHAGSIHPDLTRMMPPADRQRGRLSTEQATEQATTRGGCRHDWRNIDRGRWGSQGIPFGLDPP